MSDDNNDSFELSRRKALASMGAIGAAGALGVGGTYAQFSDTETNEITFTAGGIDGVMSTNGCYNGESINSEAAEFVSASGVGYPEAGEVTFNVDFSDIKPGDYGCFNWGIEVRNNPAWVASCFNVKSDLDWLNFEPEALADGNVTGENLWRSGNSTGDGSVQFDGNVVNSTTGEPQQGSGAYTPGELSQHMLALPYYDGDGTCSFFDENGITLPNNGDGDFDAYSVPSAFWSNSETDGSGDDFSAQVDSDNYLAPMTFAEASQVQALGTESWNASTQELTSYSAPSGASVGQGCTMLAGGLADAGGSGDNTQGYSPLQPGSTLNFGYDWHLPFSTGNVVQGDKLELEISFVFVQDRHTDAPEFDTYAPENQ